jgi:hypothetical protein
MTATTVWRTQTATLALMIRGDDEKRDHDDDDTE